MKIEELPSHIRMRWELAEAIHDGKRVVSTLLPIGRDGKSSEVLNQDAFIEQSIEQIDRNSKGYYLAWEVARIVADSLAWIEKDEHSLLLDISNAIKNRELAVQENIPGNSSLLKSWEKYQSLSHYLRAESVNDWLFNKGVGFRLPYGELGHLHRPTGTPSYTLKGALDYLPKDATIEEACNWLQAKTGQTWVLARLLECHLRPHFWLDYKPGYPAIYGDRIEGFQTRMMFQGDLCRLESDRGDALVNMFTAYDGTLVKVEPGLRVPLSELKFKRECVERVAEIINKAMPAQSTVAHSLVAAESASNDITPDPERRLARLREMGGNVKYKQGAWKITGISGLVAEEKNKGRKRSDEKTIRADLKEAAENEREAKRAGLFDGLGQR